MLERIDRVKSTYRTSCWGVVNLFLQGGVYRFHPFPSLHTTTLVNFGKTKILCVISYLFQITFEYRAIVWTALGVLWVLNKDSTSPTNHLKRNKSCLLLKHFVSVANDTQWVYVYHCLSSATKELRTASKLDNNIR